MTCGRKLRRRLYPREFLLLACLSLAGPSAAQTPEISAAAAAQSHWAFQPVRRPTPPVVESNDWPRTDIDRFILRRLSDKKLTPAPRATKEQLLRRMTFDLVGLPPTRDEVDAFLQDDSTSACEKVIDRLLASPAYGERWGRHWLDLARFGESDGFEHDTIRSNAWRFRDYVIDAFNSDKPYDRFILEQLAGDELFPDDMAALIATGFNLLGPDMADSADQAQRRLNTLSDMTDTASQVFLGLTVGCARCHDHKFEPISQRDYYQLQAFFAPARFDADVELAAPKERAARKTTWAEYKRLRTSLEKEIAKISASETEREQLASLQEKLAGLKAPPTLSLAPALQQGAPTNTYILVRGDYSQPGDKVQPGFPAMLRNRAAPPREELPPSRAVLARWVADPANPLTARVMANRIWQYHFGRGLVGSPSDFGLRGQPPTDPELLDWLASEFATGGWSMKKLHKLILLSATYQQSSAASPAALQLDPLNQWYSRSTRMRLEGEAIRDSLLAISGQLNPKMGGPGVFPPMPGNLLEGAKAWPVTRDAAEHHRRSIYIFVRRNLRFPFLEVFDAPDTNLSCPVRPASTTAPQALTLLNSEQMVSASLATARRVTAQASPVDDQIHTLYQLALARRPTATELSHCRDFLSHSPLHELCRAVFNLNAFVYVD